MKDNLKGRYFQNTKWFIFLHIIIFLLSISGVLSKFASKTPFMSQKFIILYMLEIFILFFYALAWQQVIKHIPLTVAFCNKAVSAIWSILFGITIFKEHISPHMALGAAIVLFGVIIIVRSDAKNES